MLISSTLPYGLGSEQVKGIFSPHLAKTKRLSAFLKESTPRIVALAGRSSGSESARFPEFDHFCMAVSGFFLNETLPSELLVP